MKRQTETDILEALRRLGGWGTARQIAPVAGYSFWTVYFTVRRLHGRGRVRRGLLHRPRKGRPAHVYRLVEAA